MNIVPEYDASVADAPAGYETAVQAAIDFIDHLIADPITVTLLFSWGEVRGTSIGPDRVGESGNNGNVESYGAVVGDLAAAATSTADEEALAALPAADPTHGGAFWVSDSQAKLFGLGGEPAFTDAVNGYVGLSSTYTFSWDPTDRQVAGAFDAVGVLEHEISEALGRNSYLGQDSGFDGWAPLDLFRYSGPGQHELTITSPGEAGYFSVDGQQMLLEYDNPSDGGSAGDWDASVVGDDFGAWYVDHAGVISPTDVLELDVLGFTIAHPRATDFHNDGLSNLLIQNGGGALAIGEVCGGQVSWEAQGGLGHEWTFVGAGDFLGDGLAGWMIQNANGLVEVGEVGPDAAPVYMPVASLGPEWALERCGDLLGNGKADLLIENVNGGIVVGEADPLAHQMAWTPVGGLGHEWTFAGVGDYLGVGHQQFLIENSANGDVDVGNIVGGAAQYTHVASLGPEWSFVESGDFLNDGKAQFLIENADGGLALGEVGANHQVSFTQLGGLGPEWTFVGAGDYLGLGHDQFAIQNHINGGVDVGSIAGGQVYYTQVASLGAEWLFHP